MYDVIVVGGGPAGMTAALYALRNGKSALVIEKNGFGGQITNSPKVENYPGMLSVSGNELADQMLDQILKQGADIEFETVKSVQSTEHCKTVETEEGSTFEGRTVVIATGVKHRLLGLEGEEEMIGDGISFCAVCDGDFYAGKTVCVAGGGNSALQEAVLLAEKCKEVIMLQDLPNFTGEQRLQDVLFSKPNVRALTEVAIDRLITENGELKGLCIHSRTTAEPQEIACDGLFVAIGLIPENGPFAELAELNSYGYFDSDEQCLTRTPGIFVAGDCRSKFVRQVTTAVADGATAALAACRYINGLQG
ncbi:MAG: FAD-dependent oxidoreductase [Lachnospiraceae bacterium]|nr:FAD-dependent oxidoreductase [Lachnospiraceae bacterium]